jgi:hypothetical protein
MDRTVPVWPKEKRLIKMNVRDTRYLVMMLDGLMVVVGGKYTDDIEIIINLICHNLNIVFSV